MTKISEAANRCPDCEAGLVDGVRETIPVWQCPAGHGVGLDLRLAYGVLQSDELEYIRAAADGARPSGRRSPISGMAMVQVSVPVDASLAHGSAAAGAPIAIDLDIANSFAWFSLEEFAAMPLVGDDAVGEPAAPGLVGLNQLREVTSHDRGYETSITPDDYAEDALPPADTLGGLFARMRRSD